MCGQFASAPTTFTKPSEAYEYARRPKTEWEAALQAHKQPTLPTLPGDIVARRSKPLCPLFAVENESGEELYWLAQLCIDDNDKATVAVLRYLAGNDLLHGPDARLLLAILQMQKNHNWEDAWQTIRTILQEDPIGPVQSQIDVAIDDEADEHPERGRDWSEQRYTLLLDRRRTEKPGAVPVPYSFVLSAGSDLVHRCYLAGDSAQATKVLDEMNSYVTSHAGEATGWGAEELHWANLEMQAAPEVAVLKTLGGKADSNVIRAGRVEVISFFSLGCAPCLRELSELNALQRRYGEKRLQVTAVTTYEKNSYLTPFTHSNIEVSLEKARQKSSQRIAMVLTTEGTLQSYGVQGFPAVALVDKMGRLRYIGRDINFEDDDSLGILIHKLIEE